ncbi:MAG: integrin alpha, partial [Pirellulaceae bacterium]|nr:integrin alpha [Pirellulaceae bacterium]
MRNQTRNPKKTSSHLPHKVATFRPTLAFRLWRLDGVSLLTICALVLAVPFMVPLVSVNAAQLSGTLSLFDVGESLEGAKFNGIANGDQSGISVSSAGDINGDGLDDLLIGAYRADADGTNRGESYLVYGQSTDSLLTGSLNLSDLGGAVAGAKFNGIANHDQSGVSVSGAGDVNGDGLDDLLIGAYGANAGGSDRGESYLVYGQSAVSPLTGSLHLSDVGGA